LAEEKLSNETKKAATGAKQCHQGFRSPASMHIQSTICDKAVVEFVAGNNI